MPALTLSTIRQPYWYRGWLTVVPEPAVMTGTISSVPTYPALTLSYTVSTGSHTAVVDGMEVVIKSGTTVKGRLRVAPGAVTATSLPVSEFGEGRIPIAVGDTVEVLRSWRLRDKLIAAKETFDRDSRIAYTDQNSLIAPVANAGGPWAGWLDPGMTYATVSLSAGESYAVDPDSSGTLTYSWDVVDGTIVVGTSTSANITVRFPLGTRWVTLTVTDSSNGRSAVKRIPVVVHSDSNQPLEVVVNRLEGTREIGWSAAFSVPQGADFSALADGALVIYHEDEYYGSTLGSYGNIAASRSRVKFVGYVVRDSIRVDAETNTVEFEAVSPMALLDLMPGFSQVMQQKTSPANWLEYQTGLSVFRMMLFILRWHTTYVELFDVIRPAVDRAYPAFFIQQQTPLAQLRELADANDCEIVSDRIGRLMIQQIPVLLNASARGALTTTMTLTADDRVRVDAQREHRAQVAQLEGRGVTAGGNALFSRAPSAPNEAAGFTSNDRLIASDQDDLNERTGRRYARENKTLNGVSAPEIELELPGGYDCIDFYPEWLNLTLSAGDNKRGLALTNARGLVGRITVEHDAERGAKRVRILWRGETDGPAGATYIPPQAEQTGLTELPQYDYSTLIVPPPPALITFPTWTGTDQLPVTIYQACSASNRIVRTTGIGSTLTHTEIHTATVTGQCRWMASDPFNYKRLFVLTTTGLFKTDDKTVVSPTWTLVANNAAIFGASGRYGNEIMMSHNKKGWIAAMSGENVFAYSFNYGATWNRVSIDGLAQTFDTDPNYVLPNAPRYSLAGHNSATVGHIYAVCSWASGSLRKVDLMRSTDYGQTWSVAYTLYSSTNSPFSVSGSVHVPYKRSPTTKNTNGNGFIVYTAGWDGTNFMGRLKQTTSFAVDATWASLPSPWLPPTGRFSNPNYALCSSNRSITSFTHDGRKIALVTGTGSFGNSSICVLLSTDGGATWTQRVIPGSIMGDNKGPVAGINGFSMHSKFWLVFKGAASLWGTDFNFNYRYDLGPMVNQRGYGSAYTPDDGVTWYDCTPPTFEDRKVVYAEGDLSAFQ